MVADRKDKERRFDVLDPQRARRVEGEDDGIRVWLRPDELELRRASYIRPAARGSNLIECGRAFR